MSDEDDSQETAALLRELLPDPEPDVQTSTSDDAELSFWSGSATAEPPAAGSAPPQAANPAAEAALAAPAMAAAVAPETQPTVAPEEKRSRLRAGVLVGLLLGLVAAAGLLVGAATLLGDDTADGDEAGGVESSADPASPTDGSDAEAGDDADAPSTADAPTPTSATNSTAAPSSSIEPGIDPLTGEPFPASIGDLLYADVVAGGLPHAVVRSDGQVVLRGRVPSEMIVNAGGAATAAVVGADRVINEYTVEPAIPLYLDSRLFLEDVVFFEFNSTEIDPEFNLILDLAATALEVSPTAKITVVAFTDSVGSEETNLRISEERAQAVIDYWVDGGADPSRFDIDPRGESLASGAEDDEDAAFDRRVEFVFRDFVMVPTG